MAQAGKRALPCKSPQASTRGDLQRLSSEKSGPFGAICLSFGEATEVQGLPRCSKPDAQKKQVSLMGYIGYNIGVYIGIMEKKMETTILGYIEEFFRPQSFT